jgi:hypothetical protein
MPRHRVGAKRRPMTGPGGAFSIPLAGRNSSSLAEYWITRFRGRRLLLLLNETIAELQIMKS